MVEIEVHSDEEDNEQNTEQDNEESQNVTTRKRKPMAKRSDVWGHFTLKYVEKEKTDRAFCNYCNKDYAANSGRNGMSGLKNHLKTCKEHPDRKQDNLPISRFCDPNLPPASQTIRYDPELVRRALARMTIVDELPFRFVENEGFRYFMSVVLPQFVVPSRGTITSDCFKLYYDEKLKMKEFFKKSGQRVCLTTDTWTSNQKISYMCLTAHFVDDTWKLRKMILNFIPCESHKGDDMGLQIEKCLLDWGIENVFTITVDNASSNDTTIAYLRKRFVAWKKAICDGKFLHMRCIAHIVNLVVKDGLKDMSKSVERVRTLVRYIRQSPQRNKKFKEYAIDEKIESKKTLCLDCPTRWNSMYKMLERAVMFREVFFRYEIYEKELQVDFKSGGTYGIGLPSNVDWGIVERLVKVLEHFYELTMRVSGSLYVTSNNFLEEISDVDYLLKEWLSSNDAELLNVAEKMKAKFDKYWGDPEKMNMLLFIPVVFDPRHKMKYLNHLLNDMYGDTMGPKLCALASTALNNLFEAYKNLYSPQVPTSSHSSSDGGSTSTCSLGDDNDKKKGFRKSKYRRLQILEGVNNDESELEKYLSEKTENDQDDFNVLDWWKLNAPRFPILARLARDIFAIPKSTVASESAFSTGGRIIDDFRSSLTPRITQALICYQDWVRNNPIKSAEEDYDYIETLEQRLITNVGPDSTVSAYDLVYFCCSHLNGCLFLLT